MTPRPQPEAEALERPSALTPDATPDAALPGSFRTMQVAVTMGGMQVLILLLMLARSKVVALLLEPSGVGIVSTVDQLVLFIMQVSALSLSVAPIRFLSRTLSEGTEAVNRIFQALFKSLLLSTAIGTAVCLLVLQLDGQIIGRTLVGYKNAVLIALLTVPTLALTSFFANVLASTKGYRSTIVFLLISACGQLIAAYIGIRAGGIKGLYYGNLIVGVALSLGASRYVYRSLRLAPHTPGLRLWKELRRHSDIFAYCAIAYVLAFSQPLSFLLARYSVLSFLGTAETGYFQAAFAISSVVSMVLTQAIRVHLEPNVNRAIPKADKIKAANEFQRSFAVLAVFAALPVALFPREFIRLLFSSAFTPISTVVFLFVLSDCVYLCAHVYLSTVMGIDDLKNFLLGSLVAHVSLAVLSWVLVPLFGLRGVAWAFLLSRLGTFLFAVAILEWKHGLRLPANLKGLLAYGFVALGVTGAVFRHGASLNLAGVIIRIAVFGALAFGATLFLTREEKAWLGSIWQRLRGERA